MKFACIRKFKKKKTSTNIKRKKMLNKDNDAENNYLII